MDCLKKRRSNTSFLRKSTSFMKDFTMIHFINYQTKQEILSLMILFTCLFYIALKVIKKYPVQGPSH